MKNFTLLFECKHKFGSIKIESENLKDAKELAKKKVIYSAWCENRCKTCKLKIHG